MAAPPPSIAHSTAPVPCTIAGDGSHALLLPLRLADPGRGSRRPGQGHGRTAGPLPRTRPREDRKAAAADKAAGGPRGRRRRRGRERTARPPRMRPRGRRRGRVCGRTGRGRGAAAVDEAAGGQYGLCRGRGDGSCAAALV